MTPLILHRVRSDWFDVTIVIIPLKPGTFVSLINLHILKWNCYNVEEDYRSSVGVMLSDACLP